jgi:hypothetical protein
MLVNPFLVQKRSKQVQVLVEKAFTIKKPRSDRQTKKARLAFIIIVLNLFPMRRERSIRNQLNCFRQEFDWESLNNHGSYLTLISLLEVFLLIVGSGIVKVEESLY